MRESEVERKVCNWAKKNGWLVIKVVPTYWVGMPDRMFIRDGVCFFCEFKAPGKKPRSIQNHVISLLRGQRIPVYVIDNVAAGVEMIEDMNSVN